MKTLELFHTIETHTLGEPTRIILDGFPKIKGNNMAEVKDHLEKSYDHYRCALMCEPRGHKDMVGALIQKPINKNADLGVIYMDANRWIDMCGHATIGVTTAAVEEQLVEIKEPYTYIILETPAGLVKTKVKVENKHAIEVSFINVPSFLYLSNLNMKIQNLNLTFDIAFSGSFFALVDIKQLPISLSNKNIDYLISLTHHLIEKVNQNYQIKHPMLDIYGLANVEFYENTIYGQKNIVISAQGQVDRSPCGTGTCAKLSALYAHKKINLNEYFINKSFTGAKFKGIIKDTTKIKNYEAIIPEITGSAYICGYSTHIIDNHDPLKYGFNI